MMMNQGRFSASVACIAQPRNLASYEYAVPTRWDRAGPCSRAIHLVAGRAGNTQVRARAGVGAKIIGIQDELRRVLNEVAKQEDRYASPDAA